MARGMRGAHLLVGFFTLGLTLFRDADGQQTFNGLTGFSLNPPYFNLAQGSRISASATCGQDEAGAPRYDLYCKLVGGPTNGLLAQNIQGQFCDYCNTIEPNKAHPVANAIDGTERWWQSPPLSRGIVYNEVNVTLDLGQLFHVAYVLIKFANSPRPDLWMLERSVDNGRTFTPWQYFAHSARECIERFGKQPNARIVNDDDQLCTTEYSRIIPLENGEVVVSLVNGRPGAKNFTYSPMLQDFTKATNIRLHFLRTNTLLGHLISKAQRDPTVTRRYYYSIKDISIGGRCVCHGHAQVCGGGANPDNPNRLQCECQHNTCGGSCDRCCPGFNQKPWRAATVDSPNECQPCQCFSHAFDCYYDPEVEKRGTSLDTFGRFDGGGVCINCQHNTAGVNCERCIEGFYRPHGVPLESPTGCISCRCDERTTAGCEMGSGRCICKPQFSGENCDRCADGYYYYPDCIRYPVYPATTKSPAGPIVGPTACPPGYFGTPSCQPCICDYRGTSHEICDSLGRCLCRQGVEGERCDRCRSGYQPFPNCQACLCHGAGVADSVCDPNGQCLCRSNYGGQECDECAPGYYGYPDCAACICDYRGTSHEICDSLGRCLCRQGVEGERCDRCRPGYQPFPNCQACLCHGAGVADSVCDPNGQCLCLSNYGGQECDECAPGYYGYPDCAACICDYRGTSHEICDSLGRCLCHQGVEGERCDRCRSGYQPFPNCQACLCHGAGVADSVCDPNGQCLCLSNYGGQECGECAPGYYGYPDCAACICDYRGTSHEICDSLGRCLCRQGVEGERCDRCRPGYHPFPNCQACLCDGAGMADSVCDPNGQCLCLSNYGGQECDECAPGYYGYPDCAACQCSQEGSYGTICHPLSGQCLCLPGVVGQQCDRCTSGLRFPQCSASISTCNTAGTEASDPQVGSCRCLPNVEGTLCDRCKPLYWNLAKDNPYGCIECRCDLKGTLSGVGECEQKSGQCHCKPNACGDACDSCKDGYFLLQKNNYFGCQGCQCDVGGAIGMACDELSGQCQCRKNVIGRKCTQPAPSYYFPSLHQLKFEVEDGTSPNSRPVRFGYNSQEFPEFSWRGYAVMSPAQNEVRVTMHVEPKDGRQHLFRVVLRFINPGSTSVTASIKATNNRGTSGSEQSKEVIFPVSPSPSFLTVPGDGFAEPFELTPGKWIIHIRAEGVLLDYLVLLPQDYYEASLLQENITQSCTYLPTANKDENCLLYKHIALDGFSSALGSQGRLTSRRGRKRRQARVRRPTPDHPEMATLSGRQSQLQLSLRVPHSGPYVLILEYVSEVDTVQNVNVLISGQSGGPVTGRANIYTCAFSNLCRSVAVDNRNQVAVFQLSHKTEVLLQTSTASFLLYKVYAVPAEEFSIEYVDPKVLCVSTHGRFTEDSRHCVLRQFDKPSSASILYAARDGQLSSTPAAAPQQREIEDWRQRRQSGVFPVRGPQGDGILLKFPQTEISFTPKMPLPGRYVVMIHYRQPEHISFPVEVRVDVGQEWRGMINASFCPAVSGCREVVIADGRIALDFHRNSWQLPIISVSVPPRKTLILDYIMLVPDSSYTPELLKEKPLDKSADFIHQCRGEGFYIDPRTSSQFCTDSARSLVAAYNDGALPCNCDTSGSTGTNCNAVGGQCPCRPHVIGRQCTKCTTGYYGFPYCRPCDCGRRLCNEVTGRCICPPQTVKPACDMCQNQTFSYHPLLGCENCACSPNGINANAGPQCDSITGQCSCKPRIGGRQCDRCATGYYRFPDCLPCDCNQGGVTSNVCDPDTGRCLCKRNVAGVRCNTCRESSFHFDPLNPHGCTSCFCFGATDQCQSSSKRRGKFVDMRGWRLESPDREEVTSVLNTASNTVVADIQELSPTVQTLHWVAPPSYLGDRVSSYGGFLTYQSKSFGLPSEGMSLIDRRPDVVLTGHDMTLVHMSPQTPLPDRLYQGRVQLLEGNWQHAITNRPVSREELMMVLAGLVGLRIRALYFTQSQRLSLGEVGLEGATTSGTGGPSNIVEKCSCPSQYTGDSCEKCAPGYYRDGSSTYLGSCVPCQCNGLSDVCEESTGRCLNCQYNTAGDHCERCKEGYHGNAVLGTCKACPCPFATATENFAVSCSEVQDQRGDGDIRCICRTGYTGNRCQNCAPGYYGDPLVPGGSCRPCNCVGNGNSCDPRTGVCKNTLEPGDTNTDDRCQECDNCAQTLLHDLEELDSELGKIKVQLDNATASSSFQDRLKKLEKALSDTKDLVNKFTSAVNTQIPRVDQLKDDTNSLAADISSLKGKADKRASDADKAVVDADKIHDRADDLNSQIQEILKKIQALLGELANQDSRGDVPSGNLAKLLEEAERMVNEMKNKNFAPQKAAAEEERDESKKLLDYIKSNVSKQSDQNEAAAGAFQGLLENYEDKLNELDKALKDAVDFLKKANAQNGLNAATLGDLQKRIKNLANERKTVEDQMALAENELQKTEDLVKMLSDNKTEYEQLAAQLDGAKTDLTKKVNEISKAAAQKDIVEAAEDHAKNLEKLAKDLEDAVKNASGRAEVRDAKDAIEAYKDITDAINAAEAAAKEAKEAADNALNNVRNQNLIQRAKDLKDRGNELQTTAKDAQTDLKDTATNLADLNKRLKDAKKKKKALDKDLLDAQKQLKDIKRDDIGAMIDSAKQKAALANQTASNTTDRLNEIRQEINKINVPSGGSNLNGILDDVDQTVKNLLNTIPTLDRKISDVEILTSQFSPISNISENIKKLKDLIEQARDAANRVAIPMMFQGNGYVELHPPKNLDDLKAYTAMSLMLQRPLGRGDGKRRRRQANEDDLFVLYIGNRDSSKNYIGMVLKNNELHGVYKLNGVEYTMKTGTITRSAEDRARFDRVDLRRIYQDVELRLTKDIASDTLSNPINAGSQGQESKNLLDLNPDDIVFYVGGYPDNFTPPVSLRYPNYMGCIEFSSFNDKDLSLYNFKRRENINNAPPCKRYVKQLDSDFYDGTGFGRGPVNNPLFQMTASINTRSENGLLLYIGNEKHYFIVTMEKGVIYIHSSLLPTPVTSNQKVFPTSDWTDLQIFVRSKRDFLVRVGGVEAAKTDIGFDVQTVNVAYVGGASLDVRERHNITMQPFKGCLKNLKLNKVFNPLDEKVGISNGCPTDSLMSRKAEFTLGSALFANLADFTLDSDVTVSLGFKSTENKGLILRNKQQANGLDLEMENGYMTLNFNGQMWKSNKQYHDGQWHYVTVTKRSGGIEMVIDDEDKGQVQSSGGGAIPDTNGSLDLGNENFKGCISNLYTRRPANLYKAEDLSHFRASGDVFLDVCSAFTPVQLMLDRNSKRENVKPVSNESLSPCALPALDQYAYRLGGTVSRLSYSLPLQVLQPRPHFSLEVRTRSHEGMLFFAATRGGQSHLALYMSKGRIRLSVGKQKIFNREKYNDGKWHTIMFSLEKKKFRLVVDGIRAQDGQLTNAELLSMKQHFLSPVYLGSTPHSLHKELKLKGLPKQSVSGCVRNFKMNGALMSNPTTNHGAGPCFEGQTQRGAYFSGNGTHVVVNDSFVVGSTFELLFNIRPRSLTGLLLHVGVHGKTQNGLAMGHYLTIYMLRGEVVAQVDNGNGAFMVSVKPKASLCDGVFHKISVIKRKNVVQLYVDTMDNYKIGPPFVTIPLTKDPLYVGGIPAAILKQQMLSVTSSFVGCIQDVRINSEPVSFERPSGVFGPVNLKECPT